MSDELLPSILNTVTKVAEDTASLRAQMDGLVGNGQPGRIGVLEGDVKEIKAHGTTLASLDSKRIDKLEDDVADMQASKNRLIGANGVFAALVGGWEILKYKFHL